MTMHASDPNPIVRVVFRKWNKRNGNGVIALFPNESHGWPGQVMSFEHLGQHGPATYQAVITSSTLATPEEYADLKKELESSPYHYNLKVVKRA